MNSAAWETACRRIEKFESILGCPCREIPAKNLRIGVDLGTSSLLTAVLDEDGEPVAGLCEEAAVVRDGVVMEFGKAVRIVAAQREKLAKWLGYMPARAAAAIPPGVSEGNQKAVRHVLEGAGYEVSAIADESTAAALFLGIEGGAVVDVGGGTTGISIIKNGRAVFSADEPTGGHHMTLVLAGALGIGYAEAERLKRDAQQQDMVFGIVRPVAEKMAYITKKYIEGRDADEVYVVGGASAFSGFADAFEKVTGKRVYKPELPWLVTPLGIALCDGGRPKDG